MKNLGVEGQSRGRRFCLGFVGFLPGTTHYRFRNHLDTNWPRLKHNVGNIVEKNWEGFTDLKIPFLSNLFFLLSFQRIPEYFRNFIYTFQDGLQNLIKSICSSNTIPWLGWEMENTRLELASSKMSNSNEYNTERGTEHRCSDQRTSQERLKRSPATRHFIESTLSYCSVSIITQDNADSNLNSQRERSLNWMPVGYDNKYVSLFWQRSLR